MNDHGVISRDAARYSGKWCVTESSLDGAAILSSLHDTEEEALAAQRQLAPEYPRASVGYWPTREKWDEFHRQNEEAHRFDVSYYQVVVDCCLPDGRQVKGCPLGPYCATEETAQQYLEELREEHADAYLMWGTWHCRPESPEDMSFREKVLSKMVT